MSISPFQVLLAVERYDIIIELLRKHHPSNIYFRQELKRLFSVSTSLKDVTLLTGLLALPEACLQKIKLMNYAYMSVLADNLPAVKYWLKYSDSWLYTTIYQTMLNDAIFYYKHEIYEYLISAHTNVKREHLDVALIHSWEAFDDADVIRMLNYVLTRGKSIIVIDHYRLFEDAIICRENTKVLKWCLKSLPISLDFIKSNIKYSYITHEMRHHGLSLTLEGYFKILLRMDKIPHLWLIIRQFHLASDLKYDLNAEEYTILKRYLINRLRQKFKNGRDKQTLKFKKMRAMAELKCLPAGHIGNFPGGTDYLEIIR